MRSLILTIFISVVALIPMYAQDFPEISTENTKGNLVVLPGALEEGKSIVFLAFTAEAENKLKRWYGPVYTMFLDQSGFNSMAYDCEVRLVMMFTGASQGAANKIIDNIKTNVDPSMAEMLLFFKGNFSEEMKNLGLKKKDDCYFFVLDENGKILLQEKGNYTEAKLEKIANLVEL
jgi:hypothetical protein